jgi:hypothetical protein
MFKTEKLEIGKSLKLIFFLKVQKKIDKKGKLTEKQKTEKS